MNAFDLRIEKSGFHVIRVVSNHAGFDRNLGFIEALQFVFEYALFNGECV